MLSDELDPETRIRQRLRQQTPTSMSPSDDGGAYSVPSTPKVAAGPDARSSAVEGYYGTYLGRTGGATDRGPADPGYTNYVNSTLDLPSIETSIKNSPEAQAFAKKQATGRQQGEPASRYLLRLLQSGLSTQDAIARVNQEDPSAAALYYNDARGETIGLPDAYLANGPNGWTWNQRGPEGASGGAPAVSPFTQQIRELLMKRIQQDQAPVDENASGISEAVNAARLEQTRASDAERKALAERLYAEGSGSVDQNALTQGVQQSAERMGSSLATTRAQLIAREYQRKADDLNSAMQQALASGDAETAREIQMVLAQLQAALQREGYGIQLATIATNQNTGTVNAGLNG